MNDAAILNTRSRSMWYYLLILNSTSGRDEVAVFFVVLRWDQSAYRSLWFRYQRTQSAFFVRLLLRSCRECCWMRVQSTHYPEMRMIWTNMLSLVLE